ncbi:MAG: hypothetical protein HW384_430 [Dehalococcoidia bacterium]|nr:hypothetical protein [Dehalococcoidia bacterium]
MLDASVLVKWFSTTGEANVAEAVDIMERHAEGDLVVAVPDLAYYEVANALTGKKVLTIQTVNLAMRDLFDFKLQTIAIDAELMVEAVKRAREFKITIYDASYIAVAEKCNCPLVTANPRHQGLAVGCQVIPLERWGKRAG